MQGIYDSFYFFLVNKTILNIISIIVNILVNKLRLRIIPISAKLKYSKLNISTLCVKTSIEV